MSMCGRCGEHRSRCICGEVPEKYIEFPSHGLTYCREEYGVYEYSTYESSSVLAGQQKRTFIMSYPTLEQAQHSHPDATVVDGSLYAGPPNVSHLPDEGDL